MWIGSARCGPVPAWATVGPSAAREKHGYSVVASSGHGSPQVPGGAAGPDRQALRPGALERDALHLELDQCRQGGNPGELADGWTIVDQGHSLSAQWEHSVGDAVGSPKWLTRSGAASRRRPLPSKNE